MDTPIDRPWHHFIIYDKHPKFPNQFVVVKAEVCQENMEILNKYEVIGVYDSLKEARGTLPPYLIPINRLPQDDPSILEVWI